jgi:hypothetical protein
MYALYITQFSATLKSGNYSSYSNFKYKAAGPFRPCFNLQMVRLALGSC